MMKNLKLTQRRRLLGAVVICVALIAGSAILWQMGQVAEAAILEPYHDGLVGWWRFDEGAGSVAKDSSGNGNDATIYGASWIDGKYGKAISFDGIDDYVELYSADPQIDGQNFTIMGWFKPEPNGKYQFLWCKWRPNVLVTPAETGFVFELDDGTCKPVTVVTSVINKWYFLIQVLDGSNHIAYVYDENGLIGTAQRSDIGTTQGSDAVKFRVSRPGWWGGDVNSMFKGLADEVRIYNRALSQAEIYEVFQKTPDFSSKLLAKIPKGTTQVIVTVSWQGIGRLNATIESPSESYTEDIVPVYQKTSYSTSGGISEMLNIKRLLISVPALSSDENWYITLDYNDVEEYNIAIEIQK